MDDFFIFVNYLTKNENEKKNIEKIITKKTNNEEDKLKELLEIKDTGISIERFERICKKTGFEIVAKDHYLINPIYRYKFNLSPKKQYKLIQNLPFLRNFLTTCVYYLVSPVQKSV